MGFVRVYGFQNLSPLRRPRAPRRGKPNSTSRWKEARARAPQPVPGGRELPQPPGEPGAHLREAPATHPLRHWPCLLHVLSTGAGLGLGMEKKVRQSDLSPGDHQALEDRWAPDQVITFRKSVS